MIDLSLTPNSVVLAKNDQNKVIQLPSGTVSVKNYKTLFKTGRNYNETVLNVMFNMNAHPIHQAGISTRGGAKDPNGSTAKSNRTILIIGIIIVVLSQVLK